MDTEVSILVKGTYPFMQSVDGVPLAETGRGLLPLVVHLLVPHSRSSHLWVFQLYLLDRRDAFV